mmetsp:Transcript_60529/g.100079  ORF Transcript_60529/g.100079 Transcript_60529/m.100079 type:complete len:202 (+) Transcript_60529:1043-1648(+)
MDRRDRPAETTCRSRPRGFGGGSSAQPQLAPLRSKPHCMQPLGSYSHRGVVLVQFAVCLPNTREGGAPAPHRPIGHRNASNNACPCSSLRLRLRQFVARRMRGRMKCVPRNYAFFLPPLSRIDSSKRSSAGRVCVSFMNDPLAASFNWHLPGGTPMASWMASLTSLMVALDSTDTVMFWPFSGNSEPSMAGTATVTETGGF